MHREVYNPDLLRPPTKLRARPPGSRGRTPVTPCPAIVRPTLQRQLRGRRRYFYAKTRTEDEERLGADLPALRQGLLIGAGGAVPRVDRYRAHPELADLEAAGSTPSCRYPLTSSEVG